MTDLSTSRAGPVLVVLAAGALLLTGLISLSARGALLSAFEANERVTHTIEVQRAIESLRASLRTAQAGMRGFLIDGSVVFLDAMHGGAGESRADLLRLQQHVSDNAVQRARVERIAALVEQYFEQLDQTVAVRREHGLLAATTMMLEARPALVEVLDALGEARQLEDELMAQRRDRSNAETRYAEQMVTYGSAALALLLGAAAVVAVQALRARHASEVQLRAAHTRLEAVFDATKERLAELARSISDGLWVVDRDNRFVFANPQAASLLGKPAQDWLGKEVGEIFVDAGLDYPALLERVRASACATTVVARAASEDRWYETRLYPHDGTVTGLLSDITERRNMQYALQRSRDTIEAVIEGSTDAIFVKGTDGRYLHMNSTGAAWLGLPRDQIIGRDDASLFPEAGLAPILAVDRQVLASGETVTFEESLALAGRGLRICLTTKGPLRAASGKIEGLFGVARDITERKRDEAQLREQSAMLRDLSERLMRVQEEERRMLAHELHDEIGQQLAALKLNLQTVASTAPGQAAAARIGDCIEIAETAIDQVRDRALSLRPSMLDDLGLAAALDWYCRRQSERSGSPISLTIGGSIGQLADPLPITAFRIVQEAVNNAIRHAQAAQIEVKLQPAGDALELVVQDDGCGFDPAALDARRDVSLGLVGMRQRVRWLGGEIDIDSAPGAGTRVRAILPLSGTAT